MENRSVGKAARLKWVPRKATDSLDAPGRFPSPGCPEPALPVPVGQLVLSAGSPNSLKGSKGVSRSSSCRVFDSSLLYRKVAFSVQSPVEGFCMPRSFRRSREPSPRKDRVLQGIDPFFVRPTVPWRAPSGAAIFPLGGGTSGKQSGTVVDPGRCSGDLGSGAAEGSGVGREFGGEVLQIQGFACGG